MSLANIGNNVTVIYYLISIEQQYLCILISVVLMSQLPIGIYLLSFIMNHNEELKQNNRTVNTGRHENTYTLFLPEFLGYFHLSSQLHFHIKQRSFETLY